MQGKGKFGLLIIAVCILLVFAISVGFASCKKPPMEMGDLIALHEDLTKVEKNECISCHGNKAEETSLNTDIKTPHAIHIPTLKECNVCHKKADLLEGSAAALRKQVDPQVCYGCHGPGGPGPQLYQVEPGSAEVTPESTTETSVIPHTLEGRDDCLMCHQEGGLKPFPSDHARRTNDTCTICHQTAD